MNAKDVSELKRRLNPEKRLPSMIYGCYVNEDGEILASFEKPIAVMSQDEVEHYLALFKKVLSGVQGQTLLPVGFEAAQTVQDNCFDLLRRLGETRLGDGEARQALCGEIMAWLQAEKGARPQTMDVRKHALCNLVLLLDDGFDLKTRRRDGEIDRDRSETMFSYFLCCVCPVKPRKPDLSYDARNADFRVMGDEWIVTPPEVGFLYPALENGGADIYRAMYYTRDQKDIREGFVQRVFGTEPSMPAAEQKDTVRALMAETLQEECSMEVMQSLHGKVSELIREQQEDKFAEPVSLTREDVAAILKESGVSDRKLTAFQAEMGEAFGPWAELPAVNVVSPKEFRVSTPSVSIRVDPEHADLISTRTIDGARYIMILADGAVEVNGVNIAFEAEEE